MQTSHSRLIRYFKKAVRGHLFTQLWASTLFSLESVPKIEPNSWCKLLKYPLHMHCKYVRLRLKMRWCWLLPCLPSSQTEPETDELLALITSDLISIKYLRGAGRADPWQNTLGRWGKGTGLSRCSCLRRISALGTGPRRAPGAFVVRGMVLVIPSSNHHMPGGEGGVIVLDIFCQSEDFLYSSLFKRGEPVTLKEQSFWKPHGRAHCIV